MCKELINVLLQIKRNIAEALPYFQATFQNRSRRFFTQMFLIQPHICVLDNNAVPAQGLFKHSILWYCDIKVVLESYQVTGIKPQTQLWKGHYCSASSSKPTSRLSNETNCKCPGSNPCSSEIFSLGDLPFIIAQLVDSIERSTPSCAYARGF